MARSPNLSYNQPAVAVTVDGVVGSDFADEFAIKVTFPDDLASTVVGLDKASTSFSADKTVEVTISYKPTSVMNDQLYLLYQNQRNGQGRLFDVSCATGVNERLTFHRCAVKNPGNIETGGKDQVMREVVLSCQEFTPDQSLFN